MSKPIAISGKKVKFEKKFEKPQSKEKFTDETVLDWGSYKGAQLADVPASYLIYIYENFDLSRQLQLKAYIKENMEVLKLEKERNGSMRGKHKQ